MGALLNLFQAVYAGASTLLLLQIQCFKVSLLMVRSVRSYGLPNTCTLMTEVLCTFPVWSSLPTTKSYWRFQKNEHTTLQFSKPK